MKTNNKKSQGGFIVTIELLVLTTILVLGLIVGMTDVRDAVLAELSDLSESIGALNQSYEIYGVQNAAGTAVTTGSKWTDKADTSYSGKLIDQNAAGAQGDSGQFFDVTFVAGPANETSTLAVKP